MFPGHRSCRRHKQAFLQRIKGEWGLYAPGALTSTSSSHLCLSGWRVCKWLSVEGESPEGTVPFRDSDRLVMPPPLQLPFDRPTTPRWPDQTNILIVIEFLGRSLCDGGQIGRERERESKGMEGRKPGVKMEEDGVVERLEQWQMLRLSRKEEEIAKSYKGKWVTVQRKRTRTVQRGSCWGLALFLWWILQAGVCCDASPCSRRYLKN